MAWNLLGPENTSNYHVDHNLKVVYVYMQPMVKDPNNPGEFIPKDPERDWYPPEEYYSPYYNGPIAQYEPRLKTQSYDMGLYPDAIDVSFQTVKLGGVNEEYKLTLVNQRILELIQEGKGFEEAKSIFLSEWVPPEPEWTPDDMVI